MVTSPQAGECVYFHMPAVAFTLFLHACACTDVCESVRIIHGSD